MIHHLLGVAGAVGQDGVRQAARPELGEAASGIPAQLGRRVLEVEAAGLLDAAIEVVKAGDGLGDQVPQQPIVIAQGQPIYPLTPQGRLGHAGDYVDLGQAERGDRIVHAGRGVHHAESVFHGDLLDAGALPVELGATETGQDQRIPGHHQVAAVELGADLHVQLAVAQRLIGEVGVRRGRRQVAPKADDHLALACMQGLERLVDVVPGRALEPRETAL
ncbi:hypothetical protein D3C76_712440 [compost metagenome]